MMDCSNTVQWKKSWGYIVYNGFSSEESAATSAIMELLSSIFVNQVGSRETLHLRWINCLPKQKEPPLILTSGSAEMHRMWTRTQRRRLCPKHGSCSPEPTAQAGSSPPSPATAPETQPDFHAMISAGRNRIEVWFIPRCPMRFSKMLQVAQAGGSPARQENHSRETWHTQSPRHIPGPAQPSGGWFLSPSPTSEPPSMTQLPRAPQPCSGSARREKPVLWLTGSRAGWWLSRQFLWKCLYDFNCIHFCSVAFPSGKWEGRNKT